MSLEFRGVYDLKELSLFLRDADSPVNELEVLFDEGTLTWQRQINYEYKMNRGKLDSDTVVREGDHVPLEVSFTGRFGATKGTIDKMAIQEFLENTHEDITLVTTGGECEPFACDLVLVNTPSALCAATYDPEHITFPEFRAENISVDYKAGTVTVSGKCKALRPTVERIAVS